MPGLDGFSVLGRLKADPSLRAIPVIMLTARGQERDILSGLQGGAADYVVKPISLKELLARVDGRSGGADGLRRPGSPGPGPAGGRRDAARWTGVDRFGKVATLQAVLPPSQPSGQVAQLVEHGTENPGVGSSILPLSTISFRVLTSAGPGPAAAPTGARGRLPDPWSTARERKRPRSGSARPAGPRPPGSPSARRHHRLPFPAMRIHLRLASGSDRYSAWTASPPKTRCSLGRRRGNNSDSRDSL